MYKLLDWIDEDSLEDELSFNECAVEYLENHNHLIYDSYLFENINAIHIIEKRIIYYDGIDKDGCICDSVFLNSNMNAINYLRNNPQYIKGEQLFCYEYGIEFVDDLIKNNELHKIDWCALSSNPAAMHILNDPAYFEYIDWCEILYNENAVEIVKNNLDMVDEYWDIICKEPHLTSIVEENMDNVDWNYLSYNYNATHILEKNMDRINWMCLSKNHNAIHILENNLDKIHVESLIRNKNGFTLLLRIRHVFNERIDDYALRDYHENIVFDYFDYCETMNIKFNLPKLLSLYAYTAKHLEYLKNNQNDIDYFALSQNPNIFEYDYKRMRETRQSLLWYNDIKK